MESGGNVNTAIIIGGGLVLLKSEIFDKYPITFRLELCVLVFWQSGVIKSIYTSLETVSYYFFH